MMRRLHPLTKVFIALWFSGLAIASMNLATLAILLTLCLILLTASKSQTPKALIGSLLRIAPLVMMVILIQMLAVRDGKQLVHWGSFAVYSQGLAQGAALGVRIIIIFMAAKLLTRLSPMDFDAAFRALKLPEELGFMVAYSVHLLPSIHERLTATRRTAQKRGIDFRKLKLQQKVRLYGIIALRLVSDLLQGSELRAIALELRGFRNGVKTSRLRVYGFVWMDLTAGLGLIAGAFLLLNV